MLRGPGMRRQSGLGPVSQETPNSGHTCCWEGLGPHRCSWGEGGKGRPSCDRQSPGKTGAGPEKRGLAKAFPASSHSDHAGP